MIGQLLLDFAIEYGLSLGGWAFLLIIIGLLIRLVLRMLVDEDYAALWRAGLYKLLFQLSKQRKHEKKYISNDIKSQLNIARDGLHCGRIVLPKVVNVEWVEASDPTSYEVKDGQFVVCLDPASKQEENITHLARTVVERTSLIGVRYIITEPLCTALDIALTRRLLFHLRTRAPLDWFRANILQPALQQVGDLSEWTNKAVKIDEQGLFNTILLVELEDLGRRVDGLESQPYMTSVAQELVKFVHRLATKQVGIDVPLKFERAHARVAVVRVAKAETILDRGIQNYVDAAKENIKQGIYTLYLIIWEKKYLLSSEPQNYFTYQRRCKKLVQQIGSLPKLVQHFEIKSYDYIDSYGALREGSLIRYRIVDPDQPFVGL